MTDELKFEVTRNLTPLSDAKREEILRDPGFGKFFTDHMVDLCWSESGGWHRPRVRPYGPIPMDPASAVLHYSQEIFEGLKAYRYADNSIWTFRPEENAKRMQRSAQRLALPELPVEYFIQSLKELIKVDAAWVPGEPDTSLYLRPFMFASEAFLGVRAAKKVSYYLIGSPAGQYFKGGIKPVKIWLSEYYARAAKGGTGAAKTGGNYAASLIAQNEAAEHGCDQVLFLDSETRTNLEELGGMNIFLVYGDEGKLLTPKLSGSILEGITRESVIQLAKDKGLEVVEQDIPIQKWRDDYASGKVTEAFACGTAAVITPIGQVLAKDFSIGDENAPAGKITMELRDELTGIQTGHVEDRYGWMTKLS